MALEPLLTIEDVAKILHMGKAGVYAWIKSGELPIAKRFGHGPGVFRFRESELRKWIEERGSNGKPEGLEAGRDGE